LCGDPFALAVGASRLIERDGVGPTRHRARGAEKAALDMVERSALLAGLHCLLRARHARVARERKELLAHAKARGKELAVARVAEQRDRHALRAPQQDAQDAQLAPCKIGKAVEKHIFIVDILRRLQIFLQLLQRLARIAPRRVELCKIHAVQERDIAQLVAALAIHVLDLFCKRLRLDGVGLQFLHHGEQTLQKRRAL